MVAKAFFISLIAFVALNAVAWLVLLTEGRDLLKTLFETTSAFGTVGLSMGEQGAPVSLSAFFSPAGKLLMMAMMFIGRVGPLTLAIAVAKRAGSAAEAAVPRRQDPDRMSETYDMAKRTFAVIGLGRFGVGDGHHAVAARARGDRHRRQRRPGERPGRPGVARR